MLHNSMHLLRRVNTPFRPIVPRGALFRPIRPIKPINLLSRRNYSSGAGDAVGIDIGYSTCCVAVMEEEGGARVLANPEGFRTTPAVVAWTQDGERLIGVSAKRQAHANPTETFYLTRKLLAKKYDEPEVARLQEKVNYQIVKGKNDIDAAVEVRGKKFNATEIGGILLQYMKGIAESHYGRPVLEVILAVPAHFTDAQRQAIKESGKMAGVQIEQIISEPHAAALAYGLNKSKPGSNILIFDMGGASVDVTVMHNNEGTLEIKSISGNQSLGGDDFDDLIVNNMVADFKKANKGLDPSQEPLAMQRIREAVNNMRIELSASTSSEINLPYIIADATGPKHINTKINRIRLEGMVEPLIQKSMLPVNEALEKAGLTKGDITDLVVIGGMSRMPRLVSVLERFFNKKTNRNINSDETIAMGAALQGSILRGDISEGSIFEELPLSLGLEIFPNINFPMLAKGAAIPSSVTKKFKLADSKQTQYEIRVTQGERLSATDNKVLGQMIVEDIRGDIQGELMIEITFSINVNGILEVTASNPKTGEPSKLMVRTFGSLTRDDVGITVADADIEYSNDLKRLKIRKQAYKAITIMEKALEEATMNGKEAEAEHLRSRIQQLRKVLTDGMKLKQMQDEAFKIHKEYMSAEEKKRRKNAYPGWWTRVVRTRLMGF
ncbi:chaperone protein DnaK [Planoprotostelium fungivorum]|uniref:Chaperone protein DnaK n=1 Tax=Planoprotostelium fungivorum TaxID=1890364 RepID=A0A2P6NXS3_9EUKA|nr:chaperone protein DnaK [Planoprotostelium fungivorum]